MIAKIAFFSALIIISTLAFLPDYSALPELASFSDKLNHAAAFTLLLLLYRFAFAHNTQRILMSLLFYAIFIEAVQAFLPTRTASIEDIFADSIGLIIGILLMRWIEKKRPVMGRREGIN